MLDTEFLTILGLGLVLGLRHALDTDHLAAVSTMLAQRPSLRASGMIGLSWGLGHTVVLLLVGAVVLVLRLSIPEPVALAAEFGVGAMLVFLGAILAVRWSGSAGMCMRMIMTVRSTCTCIAMRWSRTTGMVTGGATPFARSASAWPMVWPGRRRYY